MLNKSISPKSLAAPLTGIGFIFFFCFIYPIIFPLPEPVGGSILESNMPMFSTGHFLGTDLNGNDVFSRLLYGGRISLFVAIATNLLGLVIGGSMGAWSAYRGGIADSVVMRLMDTIIAFPNLVLVLALASVLEPNPYNTVVALLFYNVPSYARIARASTLRLRDQSFILVANMVGASTFNVLIRHLAPNITPHLLTLAMPGIGIAIVIEGAINFLGLGIPPPAPSWGGMIYLGQQALSFKPSLVLLPSAFLFFTVWSFNYLGEVLRSRWSER